MKKKIYYLTFMLCLLTAFNPLNLSAQAQVATAAATDPCKMCDNVPWGPVLTHQYYFTPMALPGCYMFGELRYRTRMCNGLLMYEIIDEEFTPVTGSCLFAQCIYAELHKDVEKEMILNVLGTTKVYSKKPSACYRLVELDPNADPDFKDCWTHQGNQNYNGKPIMRLPCSDICCIAEARVVYDQAHRPWIQWTPLGNVKCDEKIPAPPVVQYTVCCETVIIGGESVCNKLKVFTLPVLQSGPCTPYCDGNMSWRKSTVSSIDEANAVIDANIRFFQNAKAVPNPNNGYFDLTIVLPGSQELSVEIVDIKGQLVKKYSIAYDPAKQQYAIDAHELQRGMYLCRIASAEFGDKVIKIIKE